MPLYGYSCPACGDESEHFMHVSDTEEMHCVGCNVPLVRLYGEATVKATRPNYFRENNAQVIENLGHEPVVVLSRSEHIAAMRKAGVVNAGERIGRKGCWI